MTQKFLMLPIKFQQIYETIDYEHKEHTTNNTSLDVSFDEFTDILIELNVLSSKKLPTSSSKIKPLLIKLETHALLIRRLFNTYLQTAKLCIYHIFDIKIKLKNISELQQQRNNVQMENSGIIYYYHQQHMKMIIMAVPAVTL